MSCQEFETLIVDLARSQIMDAAARERGLAHAQACARCAARLAAEQRLAAGLRALAAHDEQREAPVALEARLRAAFRQQASLPAPPAPRVLARRFPRWSLVAAAAILVACGLLVGVWWRQPSSPEPTVVRERGPAPAPAPVERQPEPPAPPLSPRSVIARQPSLARRPVRRQDAAPRSQPPTPTVDQSELEEAEIATDFLPLSYGGDLPPLDSGQVIRVEMPRSALISYGLPLNVERANEPIKADVLLGQDGLARAIRLVR